MTGVRLRELVLPVVRSLERSEPNLRVTIEVDSSDRLAADLLAGELDLYLGRVPDRLDPASFDLVPIGPEPLSLIVGRDHPLGGNPCDLSDCLAHDWVMQPPGTGANTVVVA